MSKWLVGVCAVAGLLWLPRVHAQGTPQCTTDFCRALRAVVDGRSTEFKVLRGEKRKNDAYFWDSDQHDATKALPGLTSCTVFRERESGISIYGCALIIPAEGAEERVEALAAQAALAVPDWPRLSYEDPEDYKSARFGPAGSRTGQVIVEYIPREGENLLLLVEVRSR